MKPLFLTSTQCVEAKKFGYGSAIKYLFKGLRQKKIPYTLNVKDDFDVIVANDWFQWKYALWLKKQTGKPLVYDVHFTLLKENEMFLIQKADLIITHSYLMKRIIERECPEAKAKTSVVYLGVDTNFWHPLNKIRKNYVLYTGRTTIHFKNYISFLEKCLKERIPFLTVGDRNYVSRKKLREYYSEARLHVLPSLFEPFGLVTLEAMACGCPVAVSKNSGVAEILDNTHAVIFDPKDFSIRKLLKLSDNQDPKEQRRFVVENYNHKKYAERYMKCLTLAFEGT